LGDLFDVQSVTGGGQGEGGEPCVFDGCEGWDPIGLFLDLGEWDGEGVSHRDSEGFAVQRIAAARGEKDGDSCAAEGGDGAEDGSEVVVVGEIFEDDEGASGVEEFAERGLVDAMSGCKESTMDGVACDLVEDWANGGVDRDGFGDGLEEFGVGMGFGFVDED